MSRRIPSVPIVADLAAACLAGPDALGTDSDAGDFAEVTATAEGRIVPRPGTQQSVGERKARLRMHRRVPVLNPRRHWRPRTTKELT
jgi:hypothetical protein